jgi:hypothetical protein
VRVCVKVSVVLLCMDQGKKEREREVILATAFGGFMNVLRLQLVDRIACTGWINHAEKKRAQTALCEPQKNERGRIFGTEMIGDREEMKRRE